MNGNMVEDGIKRRNKGAHPLEIALYGKGGIGKSTVSANVSAALALTGKRVLQIGCDPKHDSTRALMGGQNIPTVLEYLRDTPKEQAVVDAVLHEGAFGVGCVEAGGPKPGVGCAGRGIISAFEFLDRNRVKDGYDTIVYDVLGDVVCGGFAVPIRSEYADAIFLVTSGEYMALYAANNILRGIRSYDGDERCRVAGIVFNARNLEDEHVRVERFARAVGLPVVISIPRSPVFAEAERLNCTVMELDGPVREQELFAQFASYIANGPALHAARPLTDEELERCILYGEGPGGRLPQASGAYDAAGDSAVAPAAQVHAAPGAVGSGARGGRRSFVQPCCGKERARSCVRGKTRCQTPAIVRLRVHGRGHGCHSPDRCGGHRPFASCLRVLHVAEHILAWTQEPVPPWHASSIGHKSPLRVHANRPARGRVRRHRQAATPCAGCPCSQSRRRHRHKLVRERHHRR